MWHDRQAACSLAAPRSEPELQAPQCTYVVDATSTLTDQPTTKSRFASTERLILEYINTSDTSATMADPFDAAL